MLKFIKQKTIDQNDKMLDLIDDIFIKESPIEGNIEPKKILDFIRLSGGIIPNLLLAFMTLCSTTLIRT